MYALTAGCFGLGSKSGANGSDTGLRGRDVLNSKRMDGKRYKSAELYVTKELYSEIQPLTSNMATKVMMFASTMIAAASVTMMDFTLDGQ